MSEYFPKPFRSFGGNINVKVDLSNYATKTDLNNITHTDMTQKLLKLKKNLLIISMTSILQLQNLIN